MGNGKNGKPIIDVEGLKDIVKTADEAQTNDECVEELRVNFNQVKNLNRKLSSFSKFADELMDQMYHAAEVLDSKLKLLFTREVANRFRDAGEKLANNICSNLEKKGKELSKEMEKFVGDEPTISYVGIRGDEDREGYISTKPNIQAIFPFRRNIWSLDVIHRFFENKNAECVAEIYRQTCPEDILEEALKVIETPLTKKFYYSKKLNALLDLDVKIFNKAVFEFLKTTDLPVGKLDYFPLVDNDDVLVKADIFAILEDSGVGVPAYYKPIEFEVDGKIGTYSRSRSGCYFCFFQQKIEWIWLYEQHPDLFNKAMEFEKDGYTWNQGESLEELIKPERVRQIKLDAIKKQEAKKKCGNGTLVGMLGDDDEIMCANCFI